MEDINFIEAVTERGIGILLLEELTVSGNFCEWFIKQVRDYSLKELSGFWHSVTDKIFGESDLIILF